MSKKIITSEVFVAYSQCPLKAFLLLFADDEGVLHDYPRILEEKRQVNKTEYLKKIKQSHENVEKYKQDNLNEKQFLIEATLRTGCWEAHCDVLTKVEINTSNKAIYEPTIVVGTYSVIQEQKTELLFIGQVLGLIQEQLPGTGKIVGMDGKSHQVKLESGYKVIAPFIKILKQWAEEKPTQTPALILNRHCSSCQFQQNCKAKAKEVDHLSLLTGITEREINKLNKKGLFTVTQLSYTYRARKQGKNNRKIKHSHALKALSIRDNKIYVVQKEVVNVSDTLIFLDIEGIPDQNFYYLIGLVIVQNGNIQEFSLWADSQMDEVKIWRKLMEILNLYDNFTIVHYGSYDANFFKNKSKIYGENDVLLLEKIQANLVNILSLIYTNIYFPTYSNSLKDIGKYLGESWSENDASGLQSLVWRYNWEKTEDENLKKTLITYNKEDCHILKKVFEFIVEIFDDNRDTKNFDKFTSVSDLSLSNKENLTFKKNEFLLEELDFVNKCAYFDYQRDKIYFREKTSNKRKQNQFTTKRRAEKYKINKTILVIVPEVCSHCGGTKLYHQIYRSKVVLDVKFLEFGIKRWIVKYETYAVRCTKCDKVFLASEYAKIKSKYGNDFYRLIVHKLVGLRQSFGKVIDDLRDIFGYHFDSSICSEAKAKMSKYYQSTYDKILDKLVKGTLIHADETHVSIKGVKAYIWVFTSMEEVIYLYYPTREADLLKNTINDFHGVLVSDFYAAYDSIDCPRQKCLIHLIRDMNDDLRSYPFDDEYKNLIRDFSLLLQSIVKTIDIYGLKKLYLQKHKEEVKQFFEKYLSKDFKSEICLVYIKKFKKFKENLFTFLDYDDVPWNNNNAEHAIKAFAAYRKINDGTFTESGIKQYLILLSIYETCIYKNINFLDFLRSGETDFDTFKKNH